MKPRHQICRPALELIKGFEGYRRAAAQLPDGRWTIGYGHTRTAREGAQVSEDDAEALLIYDLLEVTAAIREVVFTPLTGNQFDALSAFVFNIGVENFRSSAVLRRLNEGALLQGAYAMELWRKAEFEGEAIVVDALVRRRSAEKTLFLTPPDGFVPAPTPLIRPRFDDEGVDHTPAHAPVEIVPSLQGDRITIRRVEPPLIPTPVEDTTSEEAAAPELPFGADVTQAVAPADPEPLVTAEPDVAPDAEQVSPIGDADAPTGALAEAGAAEPVAYDGRPLLVDDVDDEAPPAPGEIGGEAPTVEEIASSAAAHPLQPATSGRSVVKWSTGLGAVGAVLFVIGLLTVWRGRFEHSGSVGLGLLLGVVGLFCLATAVYFLLDRVGAREVD